MEKWNVNQAVKFKEGTTGATLYPDVEFRIDSVVLSPLSYTLEQASGASTIPAFHHELDLILPDVIHLGITSGIGDWMNSLSMPNMPAIPAWMQPGRDTAVTATESLPKHAETNASNVLLTRLDMTTSVTETIGSTFAAAGDTISSNAEVTGELIVDDAQHLSKAEVERVKK